MKRIYLLLAILLGSLQLANAQQQTLQFNKDGKFKIVQFTDVHYIYNDPRSDVSIERINQVLDMEKPDLVLFTGDVIYGKPAEAFTGKIKFVTPEIPGVVCVRLKGTDWMIFNNSSRLSPCSLSWLPKVTAKGIFLLDTRFSTVRIPSSAGLP